MTVKRRRKKGEGVLGHDLDEHPSYGMVSLSRVSCGPPGMNVFGSGIKHGTVIALDVYHAERNRDAYSDRYFSRGVITKVYLSPAQFTGMLANMNTSGVPCTIDYIQGEGHIDAAPEHNVKSEMLDDIREKFEQVAERVRVLEEKVRKSLKGNVRVKDKEEILNNIAFVMTDIQSNLPYLSRCQVEKVEEYTSQAQAEVEATLTGLIHATGIERLREESQPKLLEDKNEDI